MAEFEERLMEEMKDLISGKPLTETKPFRFHDQDHAVEFVMDIWDLVDSVEFDINRGMWCVNVMKKRLT